MLFLLWYLCTICEFILFWNLFHRIKKKSQKQDATAATAVSVNAAVGRIVEMKMVNHGAEVPPPIV